MADNSGFAFAFAVAGVAVAWWLGRLGGGGVGDGVRASSPVDVFIENVAAGVDVAVGAVEGVVSDNVPVSVQSSTARVPAELSASASLVRMLKKTEGCSLRRYRDAHGWSWGYGHFSTDPNELPEFITQGQADSLFVQDIAERAEKWVRLYVKIPLEQHEFDALVSLAYNMSPRSFKKFADEVNEGFNFDNMADESIGWVEEKYRAAIAKRRAAEMRLFNEGIYG